MTESTIDQAAAENRWVRVAADADVREGKILSVKAGDRYYALYRFDGEVLAVEDACTHFYIPLSDGWIEGDSIHCPQHGGCFHVKTGEPTGGPVDKGLTHYPVRVRDGAVELQPAKL